MKQTTGFARLSRFLLALAAFCSTLVAASAADRFERGFADPPESTKPWCYWYWISDNISREGITKDLEAMKRVGIGEAFIGNIFMDDVKSGGVKALSEEWWQMVEHAVREGGRVGVNVGLFNCPGWSQSGGPWIKPEQAMRFIATAERRVRGPVAFQEKIPAPKDPFQDLYVLAFPAPQKDSEVISTRSPRVTCSSAAATDQARLAVDGDRSTSFKIPGDANQGKSPFHIDIEVTQPFIARSLILTPGPVDFSTRCELQVANPDGSFRSIRSFALDRSNNSVGVGFVPHASVAISFDPVSGTKFRLVMSSVRGNATLAEVELSGAARVERYLEKQLAKMHPTPLPMWDAYLWPATTPADAAELNVDPSAVIDVSDKLRADGTLDWQVPAGEWVILRMGLTPTGTRNSPASPEGQGLEVDKMNAEAAQVHFDAFIGKLLDRMPASDRKAFRRVIADSYEMGSQNWTDGLRDVFKSRYGYDPQPWLPVLTGRVIGSADQSDRFLWDLRRLVADQVSYGYVAGLRRACNDRGLRLWLENYGHWGFPGEFLQYGGQSDDVSGEFWATGDLGSIELRAASSAAHIYGKTVVSAEAFTSTVKFESTPWSLKKRGDWALTEGINHWVLHVNIHQPWEDRLPGVNAWFSTEFNRHNTWFEQGREWIDYYRRCDFLLQQGKHVADVAYFIGEDTPKMTGIRKPELPAGYNFDYINAEVIEQRLKVRNGRFVLPDGMSYRLLVLPELDTMRPKLLRKIHQLVRAGGAILGNPPSRSPSMQGFPECDLEVQRLAAELWAKAPAAQGGELIAGRFGKGRVFRSSSLTPVLDALEIPPDVTGINPRKILWTHRSASDAEIYFMSNQSEQPELISPEFRVQAKAPEFWDAVTREIRPVAVFQTTGTGIRVPMKLEPRGSLFVVFRKKLTSAPVVTEVLRRDEVILSALTAASIQPKGTEESSSSFTMAAWVRPSADIGLPPQADAGVQLQQVRNELITAFHGDTLFPEGGYAGAGLSIGRNGVVVYEHAGHYYAPTLTFGCEIKDWTHVAIVYQENRPTLYLNGKRVHEGVQSKFKVRSGLLAEPSGNSAFQGQFAGLQGFPQRLSEKQISELAATRPASSASGSEGIVLSVAGKSVQASLLTSEPFTLLWSNGRQSRVQAEAIPAPAEIPGPWKVQFLNARGAPAELALNDLVSLSEHAQPEVKYYSGTVSYHQTMQVSPDRLADKREVWLNLGRVESMAEVIVNGQNLGIYWKPPYQVNISRAVRAGANSLEVRVTGVWRNALIGGAKFPAGLGTGPNRFQPFLTTDLKIRPEEMPPAFGLIGPVRLQTAEHVLVSP